MKAETFAADPTWEKAMLPSEERVIARFDVPGKPIPYAWHPSGCRNEREMRAKIPNHALVAFQGEVKERARRTMNGRVPYQGPVELEVTFFRSTPLEMIEGDPWFVPLKLSEKGGWKKGDPTAADTTNLLKSLEDSLEGIVFVNDVQVVRSTSAKLYGSWEGSRVVVKEFARRV